IAGVYNAKDINSITTGPWSETSTWDCGCHPGFRDKVTIQTGDTVYVDEVGYVENLAILSGATLTMEEDFQLNVFGDWDITGETNFSNGAVAFVGETNQDISIL